MTQGYNSNGFYGWQQPSPYANPFYPGMQGWQSASTMTGGVNQGSMHTADWINLFAPIAMPFAASLANMLIAAIGQSLTSKKTLSETLAQQVVPQQQAPPQTKAEMKAQIMAALAEIEKMPD